MKQFNNETINVFIKKLPFLHLSILKVLRYKTPLQFIELAKLCKIYHPIVVKLEPFEIEKIRGGQIYLKGLESNKSPLVPTKTLWIDLVKSEKQILAKMRQKTRYNIKKARRNNLNVKIIPGDKVTKKQLQSFYHLWSQGKPYNWLFKPKFNELRWLAESFGKKCFFVFTINNQQLTINNNLLASCLILTSKNMAFYWHNCSTAIGKKLFAPSLCIWEAIRESKKRNLKIFDFEGLWDERFPALNKGWKGFTRFKKGFLNEKL